jgi:glucose-1-phosphate cytidylyltransferase
MEKSLKVVILCGGKGTRIKAESGAYPKPLVEISGRPILWHIMKIYAHYGFNSFVLCLGYKGKMIKEYFLNYEVMENDITLELGGKKIQVHGPSGESDWRITFADTGQEAQTGARVKRVQKYISDDLFMLTYGDAVADINPAKLLEFHRAHGKIGTITGIHPSSRFGELIVRQARVMQFTEKPQVKEGYVNGGFFVFNRRFFEYLTADEGCYLEREPLERLAADGELMVYRHEGFWQCMDTYRELTILNELWERGMPPWKVWSD